MPTINRECNQHRYGIVLNLPRSGRWDSFFRQESSCIHRLGETRRAAQLLKTMMDIKNKNVLITGGASGLGFTYAQRMLQNGAKTVALLDLSSSPGQTSVTTLEKQFGKGKAMFFPCDVSNTQQFEETFKKVVNTLTNIDIFINNAGMFNDLKWEQTIRLNVGGVVQGTLLAFDHMGTHKGGKGGVVVNIGSIVSLDTFPVCPVYCASKHDVLAFSRCMAHYHPRTGIRVVVMCPGVTTTNLLVDLEKKVFDLVSEEEIQQVTNLPAQETENVADAMVKLIQKGPNGAIWVSEEGQPPSAVEIPPVKKVQVTQ